MFFWQNMLSHLQSAHVRALAERSDTTVTIIGLDEMPTRRVALGWSTPNFGEARVIASPEREQIRQLVGDSSTDSVHLIAGWRGQRLGRFVSAELARKSAKVGLLSEGADNRGWKGMARRLIYSKDRLLRGQHIDFILAMGESGARWFRSCGYPRRKIFPYAYITEEPISNDVPFTAQTKSGPVEILYMGQCIHRKGVDLAIQSLASLRHLKWELKIVGDGEHRSRWHELAFANGIGQRVRFFPAMPYTKALSQLATADFLILPSRFDGWGAVVNEALMTGTPVICSDQCGAKDLIRHPLRGEVFRSGSISELRRVLERRISNGKRSPDEASQIWKWSRCLGGAFGASYLIAVINHVYGVAPCPAPPWCIEMASDPHRCHLESPYSSTET